MTMGKSIGKERKQNFHWLSCLHLDLLRLTIPFKQGKAKENVLAQMVNYFRRDLVDLGVAWSRELKSSEHILHSLYFLFLTLLSDGLYSTQSGKMTSSNFLLPLLLAILSSARWYFQLGISTGVAQGTWIQVGCLGWDHIRTPACTAAH